MQVAVAHAALTDHGVSEAPNLGHPPSKDHHLQTVIVIEMNVQGGNGNFVVIMLSMCQASREIARIVFEDVA